MRIKVLDIVLCGIALALTAGSAVLVFGRNQSPSRVVIRGQSRDWIFPLDTEEKLHVSGPIGDTVVVIRNGNAQILESPCTNQSCVAAGTIHRAGQWVACMPNDVFISIEGARDETLDATAW
ncbi:hypothetical protein FACS1894172_13590 [Spirochaetia bacterium]|nr:hypothetical protein FACS1894164_12810 [Spirochaetia bacterium]GHU33975.1 hypothetical protein FACS1894172_13590 [Spirochaetia bacterium]